MKMLAWILVVLAAAACGRTEEKAVPATSAPQVQTVSPEEAAKIEAERAAREARKALERDYREAHSLEEEALRTKADYEKTGRLMDALEAHLKVLPRLPEAQVDALRVADHLIAADSTHEGLLLLMASRFDAGDREIASRVLGRIKAEHLRVLREERFNSTLRWREEDILARYRDPSRSPYYCSDVPRNVIAVHRITKRLSPDAPEARTWLLHATDLILYRQHCDETGDSYRGEDAYAEAYEGYLALGLRADADRVARTAAQETLGWYLWGSTFILPQYGGTPPERLEYLEYAKVWLARVTPALREEYLREVARHAEEDQRYTAALKFYELLDDAPNRTRMTLLAGR